MLLLLMLSLMLSLIDDCDVGVEVAGGVGVVVRADDCVVAVAVD